MDLFEQELQEVYAIIQQKHGQCMELLEKSRERISRT